jgi:hypothetical protein
MAMESALKASAINRASVVCRSPAAPEDHRMRFFFDAKATAMARRVEQGMPPITSPIASAAAAGKRRRVHDREQISRR